MMNDTIRRPGLQGVIAAETRMSRVDGLAGELIIAGYRLDTIAPYAIFEEMVYLLWHDRLPTQAELAEFQAELASLRALPPITIDTLRHAAEKQLPVMDALRMASGLINLNTNSDNAIEASKAILATMPTIVATYWRLLSGKEPLAPSSDLSHASNYLYMLDGEIPSDERVRALNTYLNTVIDHGFNASTFAGRVIISTQSDRKSVV